MQHTQTDLDERTCHFLRLHEIYLKNMAATRLALRQHMGPAQVRVCLAPFRYCVSQALDLALQAVPTTFLPSLTPLLGPPAAESTYTSKITIRPRWLFRLLTWRWRATEVVDDETERLNQLQRKWAGGDK